MAHFQPTLSDTLARTFLCIHKQRVQAENNGIDTIPSFTKDEWLACGGKMEHEDEGDTFSGYKELCMVEHALAELFKQPKYIPVAQIRQAHNTLAELDIEFQDSKPSSMRKTRAEEAKKDEEDSDEEEGVSIDGDDSDDDHKSGDENDDSDVDSDDDDDDDDDPDENDGSDESEGSDESDEDYVCPVPAEDEESGESGDEDDDYEEKSSHFKKQKR